MGRSKRSIVDEVLDALVRQGVLMVDRDGNCFARPLHDTKSPYPHLIWGVKHSPHQPPDNPKETE